MASVSIRIEGLEKIYRGSGRGESTVHALKPLHLEIAQGEVFGLLGPNGAGKTTLVKLLLGIVHPTSGSATILERPAGSRASKEMVGYLPENHRYPAYLTADGVLRYFGALSGLNREVIERRGAELLELLNMTRWRRTKIKKFSKGMMQRIGLVQALLNDPDVIFLDEPTDGVDPVGRKEIRDIITRLRDQGKTVFLNSHLLSEVEMICDRVAILTRGQIARIGTVRELTERASMYRIETSDEQREMFADIAAEFAPYEVSGNAVTVQADDLRILNDYLDKLRSNGILIRSVTPVRQTLEDLFIDIVGKGDAK